MISMIRSHACGYRDQKYYGQRMEVRIRSTFIEELHKDIEKTPLQTSKIQKGNGVRIWKR